MLSSFSTFQYLRALIEECAWVAIDPLVKGAAVNEEENKVLFACLLEASRYNCSVCNPSWQTWGRAISDTEDKHRP